MPFSSCTGCPKCNTTLEISPSFHSIPAPHKFIVKFDQNTGIPYEICSNCVRTRTELEKDALNVEPHRS